MKGAEHKAEFRFYEELNDFLSSERVKSAFSYCFSGHPSVKDAIEAIGVPHTEVDLICVNGHSVDFNYQLRPEDRVAVYPTFEALDISPVIRLRPEPLRHPAYILDVHLGKLARWLRLLGFDADYRNNFKDEEIVEQAQREHRIILTQDRGILKRKCVTHGYWVRSRRANQQIMEVLRRFDLHRQIKPFTRCLMCNGLVERVEKTRIIHRLKPKTKACFDVFYQCQGCGKIYWQGSHYDRMLVKMKTLIDHIEV
ncbi:Mut7-C ubiquitin/RNAse domain-containing protein [bacterium]|nr:Mut7-C ubiquitin/RNAse domain-containing protein [bacterium]